MSAYEWNPYTERICLFVLLWLAFLPPSKVVYLNRYPLHRTKTRIEIAEILSDTMQFFYVFFVVEVVEMDNMK